MKKFNLTPEKQKKVLNVFEKTNKWINKILKVCMYIMIVGMGLSIVSMFLLGRLERKMIEKLNSENMSAYLYEENKDFSEDDFKDSFMKKIEEYEKYFENEGETIEPSQSLENAENKIEN